MKRIARTMVILIAGLLINHCSRADEEVLMLPIGMYNSEIVPRPLAFNAGECPDPHNFPLHNNQILAELLLLCNALKQGGISPLFDFKDATDYLRIITNAGDGKSVMPGFVIWKQDINTELFYVSDPILKEGEFTKGLYTTANHKKLLAIKNSDELTSYLVAANPNWKHDNAEIDCIGLKYITGAFNPITMARMVAADRADFLLFPFFHSPDLISSLGGVRLVPVPGVKIGFNDSLHFIISKKHPQGLVVYQALQKGLAKLRADGTQRYIYEQLGFFNPQVNDWKELGCKNKH